MTAEIAILNNNAVALAADSAVTSGTKVYSSVNKLFALSKSRPVGVMFYNYAEILGVPWESIIKIYRDSAVDRHYSHLSEYFDDFLSFLRTTQDLFTEGQQRVYIEDTVISFLEHIKSEIDKRVKEVLEAKGRITQVEVSGMLEAIISDHHQKWSTAEFVPDWDAFHLEEFIWREEETFIDQINAVFGNHSFSPRTFSQLTEISGMLFAKNIFSDAYSGVVVAGFGEKETFPALCSCWIEGIVNSKLKLRSMQCAQISHENSVSLIPFAQKEMVATFMEGIEPKLRDEIFDYVNEVFEEYPDIVVSKIDGLSDVAKATILKELKDAGSEVSATFVQTVRQILHERYISPVIQAIGVLPKDELASMAESLVSLTSQKRRFTIYQETVGGPVDVAVISKGDGFVWVKRKSYFDPYLNVRHYSNYFNDILARWRNQDEKEDHN